MTNSIVVASDMTSACSDVRRSVVPRR